MTNISDLSKARERKTDIENIVSQGDDTLMKIYDNVLTTYKNHAEVEDLKELAPTLHMFSEILVEAYNSPAFDSTANKWAGLLRPMTPDFEVTNASLDEAEEALQGICHIALRNAFHIKGVHPDPVVVVGLFTKQTLKNVMGIVADDELDDDYTLSVDNIGAARTYLYDYLYEHPDVDSSRDVAPLAIIGYELIGSLITRGYSLTRYSYTNVYNKENNRKQPGPILMQFNRNVEDDIDKIVYVYFDSEAVYKAYEYFLDCAYGIDN